MPRQPPTIPPVGDDALDDLPAYRGPGESQLEPHRRRIEVARRKGWPYEAITRHLAEMGVVCTWQSVAYFCKRRGIKKGTWPTEGAAKAAKAKPAPPPEEPPVAPAAKPEFDYRKRIRERAEAKAAEEAAEAAKKPIFDFPLDKQRLD